MKRASLSSFFVLLGLLILCALAAHYHGVLIPDPLKAWNRVMWPLIRISFFVSLGLFAALIIEGAGWTDRLAILARPFMRWGHLTNQMGSAFTGSFFSGTTSLAMLATFLREGTMTRKEATLSVLLNTFPSYFLHLPTTFFIILPLVGPAGVVYLLVTFAAALLRFVSVLVYSRLSLQGQDESSPGASIRNKGWKELVGAAGKRLSSRITRILLIVAPVYLIVLLLSDMGFFEGLRKALALGIGNRLFPVEGISVVILSLVAEVTSGYAAAGAMLHSGSLTLSQTVLALLIGQVIGAPLRAFRHQLPYYMGIFSPGMGIYLIIASQCFRILSLVIAAALFLLIAAGG